MTRINTCIPKALTDQHLVGEYNEIRRPVNLARKRFDKHGKKAFENLTPQYKLGGGHVLFFYNKLKYLHKRFDAICTEMKVRGFNVNTGFDIDKIPDFLYNDWECTNEANLILKNRLREKILNSKVTWRYYGKPIVKEEYLTNILKPNENYENGIT